MPWGIAQTASMKEKLKSQFADYLNGLNSAGEISYSVYDQLFDEFHRLAEEFYNMGAAEAKQPTVIVGDKKLWEIFAELVKCINKDDPQEFLATLRKHEMILTHSSMKHNLPTLFAEITHPSKDWVLDNPELSEIIYNWDKEGNAQNADLRSIIRIGVFVDIYKGLKEIQDEGVDEDAQESGS